MKVLIVDNNPTTFTIEIPKNLQSLNESIWTYTIGIILDPLTSH